MSIWLAQLLAVARRYPVAAASIGVLLVLGAANYFLWRKAEALELRADQRRRDGEAVLLALSGHPRLEANAALAQAALRTIEENLITETDLAGNLDYFYQIEKTARIRLSAISQLTSSTAAGQPYRAIPFSLRLTGSYAQLIAYLHQLETGPRLLRVRSFHFSQSDPAADQLSLDLTVDVLGHP